jgi:hypothetical protein
MHGGKICVARRPDKPVVSEGAKIAWQRYRISRSEGLWLDKRPLPAKPSSAEELLAQLVPAG